MKTCDKCGNLRSEVLSRCYACVAIARGEKIRAPMPLTPAEQRAAEAFLGKINGSLRRPKTSPRK